MEKKLWYAVLLDETDWDWEYGSYDLEEAKEMASRLGEETVIFAVNGDYGEIGNAATDPTIYWELRYPWETRGISD